MKSLLYAGVAISMALFQPALGQVVDDQDSEMMRSVERQPPPGDLPDLGDAARRIVDATNQLRQAEQLPAAAVNNHLARAAGTFAEYMAKSNRYGHHADGQRPADRAASHGYEYCIVSENIAYQYNSAGFSAPELASRLFEGWKTSPEHRRNMLDHDVMETAVAVARSDETGYYYAVQMFGRPKSAAIEFTILNETASPIEYSIRDQKFSLPVRAARTHERCRPSSVRFDWPGDSQESTTIEPKSGDRFTVAKNDEAFVLRKE